VASADDPTGPALGAGVGGSGEDCGMEWAVAAIRAPNLQKNDQKQDILIGKS
jgi:hypothetical protein